MLLAMVPAAPPTWKKQRATSCPAPISAMAPYFAGSRLIASAFCRVLGAASSMREPSKAVWVPRFGVIAIRPSIIADPSRHRAYERVRVGEDLARLGR